MISIYVYPCGEGDGEPVASFEAPAVPREGDVIYAVTLGEQRLSRWRVRGPATWTVSGVHLGHVELRAEKIGAAKAQALRGKGRSRG